MTHDPETSLKIEPTESDHYARGVRVSVRCHGFAGHTTAYLALDDLAEFAQGIAELDETRNGSVKLESMSPGNFRLRLFSLDSAGHLGVEGELAKYSALQLPPYGSSRRCDRVAFGFEIDPSTLQEMISWAQGNGQILRIVENTT